MKTSRFTETQIVSILKSADAGMRVSELCRVVHAWVLSRADRPGALPLFEQALRSDVSSIQGGTTGEGIHAGAIAGTVDLLQRCFTGLEAREDALWRNPQLPEGILGLRQRIHYRRHEVGLYVTHSTVRGDSSEVGEAAIRLRIRGDVQELRPGEVREFRLMP